MCSYMSFSRDCILDENDFALTNLKIILILPELHTLIKLVLDIAPHHKIVIYINYV